MHRVRWETPLLVLVAVGSAVSAFAAPFAFVANYGDDDVSIVDTATNQSTGNVSVGHHPWGVAVDPEGAHVYVGNLYDNSVSIITTATMASTPVLVGDGPTGVAVKLPGTRVYVANSKDFTVSVIDTATNQVLTTVPVDRGPVGVAVNPAGTPAYVVNRGSDSMTVIDTNTNQVLTTVPAGSKPTHVAVSPAGDRLYVTNHTGGHVLVFNATTLNVTGTISVGGFPEGVAFSPDGAFAYVANSGSNTLSVIDTGLQAEIATIPVGEDPEDVAVHPDGTRVYVLNHGERSISVIDTASNKEIDSDGDTSNGLTRIAVGFGPLALSNALVPGLLPPRLDKLALVCQATIAVQARAFAKVDQLQRTACQNQILKDVAGGKGSQQAEATCALALDLSNPNSALALARSGARDTVAKKCVGVGIAALNRPCDREASSVAAATGCVLDQHETRVSEMVADTFAADTSNPLTKAARTCQATIAKSATRLAQSEHAKLGGCLVRVLKGEAKHKHLAVSGAACAKTLDPDDPKATLAKLRAAVGAQIAKKCAGLVPADIGNPCDPSATTIGEVAGCVLAGQAKRVEKMIAAEFNDACPMLTAVGLGRGYPDVCTGH
ncbi:MAG: YncE family protein [Deltaproteobacteria bacterium]|nr:YncE family protein [Deltaproteobacteria bacterium]